MPKPVVLAVAPRSSAIFDVLGADFEIRRLPGADPSALLKVVPQAKALLICDATPVTAQTIAAAPLLRVIACAGERFDHVDVETATVRGIAVVNAPNAAAVSTAELSIAHLLGLARHLPEERIGQEEGGIELYRKTIGILGLGRTGQLVAQRLRGFEPELIGYDPHLDPAQAARHGVRLCELEEVMETADFITIHVPRTPRTVGLIGEAQLSRSKPGLRIVNMSHPEVIDRTALAAALRSGRVYGAGLDYTAIGRTTDQSLGQPDFLQLTPRVAATTLEAQQNAELAIATSARLVLERRPIPDVVNLSIGTLDKQHYPSLSLLEKLGRFLGGLLPAGIANLDLVVHDQSAGQNATILKLAALKGVLSTYVIDPITLVNAPLIADRLELVVGFESHPQREGHDVVFTLIGRAADGAQRSVSGALTGLNQVAKLTAVDELEIEVPLAGHHLVIAYQELPSMVAIYGRILGDAGINITALQIARDDAGDSALSVLTTDSAVTAAALAEISELSGVRNVRRIDIVDS